MRRSLWTVAAVLLTAAPTSAHANSVSYMELAVDGRVAHAVVRLPLDDVDLLLRLDGDLDGQVSAAELDASKPHIAAYVAKHASVAVDGSPLPGTVDRAVLWRDPSGFQYLQADVSYQTPSRLGLLSIHTDFLSELYPAHKTLGRIRAGGREDRFTFDSAVTYERRVAPDRIFSVATDAVGVAIVVLLLLVRRRNAALARFASTPVARQRDKSTRRRDKAGLVVVITLVAATARADVIMSAPALNATLKTMERLTREASAETRSRRDEALFQLGTEADGLATILNLEVESHGTQERALIDLALSRTKELGVAIAYNREKKKFFYDGAAFAEYVTRAPRGTHAAAAEFKLLSYQFYQSPVMDMAALVAGADAKKRFLAQYPRFEANAEMRLYLAVDYRDLHRRYLEAHDAPNAAKYRRLVRAECLRIARLYPHAEQADAARQLLRGLR